MALTFVPAAPIGLRRGNGAVCAQRGACVRRAGRAWRASAAEPQIKALAELKEAVEVALRDGLAAVAAAEEEKDVEALRVAYLGKKGAVTTVMKSVGKLAPEERPVLGAVVNKAKDELAVAMTERKEALEEAAIVAQEESEWIDVTMPGLRARPRIGRIHPINSTTDLALDIFAKLGYDVITDLEYNREIETDYYCFEALNCAKDHPAREMQDTFYLEEDKSVLLRTQTSAVQIRYMEKNKPPFKIIAPGRVYRRDSVDATHTATFHQIEILAIDKFGKLNFGNLKATIIHFLKQMLGDEIQTRFRGSYFPFTEPSVEVDVFFRGRWLEVLGCGMVDPEVLKNVGLDPEEYGGFAAGFGVERFAMVMHEITDIRELYNSDLRFLSQFMID